MEGLVTFLEKWSVGRMLVVFVFVVLLARGTSTIFTNRDFGFLVICALALEAFQLCQNHDPSISVNAVDPGRYKCAFCGYMFLMCVSYAGLFFLLYTYLKTMLAPQGVLP
jgi:hypothetical protein